jgi:hypothetical protein
MDRPDTIVELPAADPTMDRLESQLSWYDRNSRRAQLLFKWFKAVQIAAAASIPVLSVTGASTWVIAALGALIVVIEGVLQLNQYQSIWITYRSTAESLKHEKYLYLAKAGPYAPARNPHGLLAERVEALVSQEHSRWISVEEAGRVGVQHEARS